MTTEWGLDKLREVLGSGDEPHLMTGEQYKESLRDDRVIIDCNGERIEDIPTHPHLKRSVDTIAETFDAGEEGLMGYLKSYYGPVADALRAKEACYAGPLDGLGPWIKQFADAGVAHFVVRFAGDHEPQMRALAKLRSELGQ